MNQGFRTGQEAGLQPQVRTPQGQRDPAPHRKARIHAVLSRVWLAFGAGVWWLSRMMAYVSAIALIVTIVVLMREAIGRYFFDSPTTYSYPLTKVILLLVVYFGLAYTATTDGHVSSDVFYSRLPLRGQETIQILTNVSAITLAYLLAAYALQGARKSFEIGATIPDLFGFPLGAAQSIIVAGSVALALVCITKLPYHVANLVRGERAPFPPPSWRERSGDDSELELREGI